MLTTSSILQIVGQRAAAHFQHDTWLSCWREQSTTNAIVANPAEKKILLSLRILVQSGNSYLLLDYLTRLNVCAASVTICKGKQFATVVKINSYIFSGIRAALTQLNYSSPSFLAREELQTSLALHADLPSFRATAAANLAHDAALEILGAPFASG